MPLSNTFIHKILILELGLSTVIMALFLAIFSSTLPMCAGGASTAQMMFWFPLHFPK